MFVIKKRQPAQVLTALEEYLRGADELVQVVTREALGWSEISYAELEELIAAGRLNDFMNWQEKYSALVNEKLAPAMIAAAIAAAKKSTSNKIIISDSDEFVKLWIRNRGATLISQLSDQSRRAIANILLIWQERLMQPRTMARQIRPLIGLNDRQASAVDNYRRRIYNRYLDGGLNPRAAGERADKAAFKYSVQQHARRAETIVHTELAFAYNRGAHEGVTRAINAKLMPHCEMVWTTAGTNRVCGRCMELKDTVVGRTDEGGVQIPPLHPRCRCTIMYRELVGGSMSAQNDIPKWPPRDKSKVLSKEEYATLRSLAETNSIALSGVKKFDGSADVVREIIETLATLQKNFPAIRDERYKLTLNKGYDVAGDNSSRIRARGRRCLQN